jgi:cell division protein FtsB
MDLNPETLQSLAVGASGGIPLTLLLLVSVRSLKDSFNDLSTRLLKLEVIFEATCRDAVQKLTSRVEDLETEIEKLKDKT